MAGVVNLISRQPTEKTICEFLVDRTCLGGTDGSLFLGQQFTKHFGGTLLDGGFAQDAVGRNNDSWTGRVEIPLTPRHNLGLVGTWEQEGKTKIGLEGYYTRQQRLEYNPYRDLSVPNARFEALVQHSFGHHMMLYINAGNLGDIRQTKYNLRLLPNRESDGLWTVDVWAPLDGRVMNGGARLTL